MAADSTSRFLGLAQADQAGNLNVSKFGVRLAGAGGFTNISESAKRIVFVGTFTAGGLQISIEDGQLRVVREGASRKFVGMVEHLTFSGEYALKRGQPVLYITERCVFKLTEVGLELVEVAPGVDIERDIVAHMDFAPVINAPRLMDARIFRSEPMGLRSAVLRLKLHERFSVDATKHMFFINFEGLEVQTTDDIEPIRREVFNCLHDVQFKPHAIVNYDNFSIRPEVIDAYSEMVNKLVADNYSGVTRYTTSSFLRMKLGNALHSRGFASHIYETPEEAAKHQREVGLV